MSGELARGRGELEWRQAGRQAGRQGEEDTTQASCARSRRAVQPVLLPDVRPFSRQANVEPPIIREKPRRAHSYREETRLGGRSEEGKKRDKGDVWTCLL